MMTVDELVEVLRGLPPSERAAVRDQVWPRTKTGPKPVDRNPVCQATNKLLREMSTTNGRPHEVWVMELTLEKLRQLNRNPTRLFATWKRTAAGQAVLEREGQEGFEVWAQRETEKMINWKGLKMAELVEQVALRLGDANKSRGPKGGKFHQYVMEAKDEYLMNGGFTWKEIPKALRHKKQPGFRGDPTTFAQKQKDTYDNMWVGMNENIKIV